MAHTQRRVKSKGSSGLFMLATLLISNADDEDEHTTCLAVAQLALAHAKEKSMLSAKYGPRGPYDQVKSQDFFHLLLHDFTNCQFKNWLRSDSFLIATYIQIQVFSFSGCLDIHFTTSFVSLKTILYFSAHTNPNVLLHTSSPPFFVVWGPRTH
jgi:hypothetical protein